MSDSPGGVLVTSRSFAEYLAFFNLDESCLPARVLDCSAGASSFVAERADVGSAPLPLTLPMRIPPGSWSQPEQAWPAGPSSSPTTRTGSSMTGTDPHLAAHRCARTRSKHSSGTTPAHPSGTSRRPCPVCRSKPTPSTWPCAHTCSSPGPPITTKLWHLASLVELCRVATEVRVFPLVLQGTGEAVEFLPSLRDRLEHRFGISSNIVAVAYEFQRGAHHMLQLSR